MGAYQYVDFPCLQVFENLAHLLGFLGAAQELDADGEVLQPVGEGVVMLHGQHGGGHQYGRLLVIGGSLERGADGDFGFAEPHIAAHQPVHGSGRLHIAFDGGNGLDLIGCVFESERSLEFLLHVGVGREGETCLLAARGIKPDQVARHVLHLGLGAFLQPLPGARSKLADLGRGTFLSAVFRQLMQRVYRHKHHVAALEIEFNHFLRTSVGVGLDQTTEFGDAMVDMHYVIADFDLVQLLERHGHASAAGLVAVQGVVVEAVEYLMVGEIARLPVIVDEAFMDGRFDGSECDLVAAVFEDVLQSLGLTRRIAEHEQAVSLVDEARETVGYQFEIFMIQSLWRCVEYDAGVVVVRSRFLGSCPTNDSHSGKSGGEFLGTDHAAQAVGLTLAGYQRGFGVLFVGDSAYARGHVFRVLTEHGGVVGYDVEQTDSARCVGSVRADHGSLGHLGIAKLRLDVESADGVDFVIEHIHAVGHVVAVTVDVQNAAAHGELSRLVDIIHLVESEIDQLLAQVAEQDLLTRFEPDCIIVKRLLVGHLFRQSLG